MRIRLSSIVRTKVGFVMAVRQAMLAVKFRSCRVIVDILQTAAGGTNRKEDIRLVIRNYFFMIRRVRRDAERKSGFVFQIGKQVDRFVRAYRPSPDSVVRVD